VLEIIATWKFPRGIPVPRCAQYTVTDFETETALVSIKTKSRSRRDVEDDLICALSGTEPRISMLSNSKQAQPLH